MRGAHAETEVASAIIPSTDSPRPGAGQAGQIYGNYLHDRIVSADHLLRKINQVVDFSFVNDLLRGKYNPDFGRPAEDPEFMLRLCLLPCEPNK